jgi:uncharacterized RDD family membrane protein YckC
MAMRAEWRPGHRVGEYVLEAELGRGGCGLVFEARHRSLPGRRVALKLPCPRERADLLRRGGVLQDRLRSPHVVRVVGLDVDHDPPYLALELVEGGSLRDRLRRGPLEPAEAVTVLDGVLDALVEAHGLGLVHGDLKPENVLFDDRGVVRVTDFGLTVAPGPGEDSEPVLSDTVGAETGGVAGTLLYMAPEQLRGGPIDGRTDLYALGLLWFEMLTGRLPEGGDSPRLLRPELPEAADRIFLRCYARAERRYPTAAEMRGEIRRLAPPIRLEPGPPRPRPAPPVLAPPPSGEAPPPPRLASGPYVFPEPVRPRRAQWGEPAELEPAIARKRGSGIARFMALMTDGLLVLTALACVGAWPAFLVTLRDGQWGALIPWLPWAVGLLALSRLCLHAGFGRTPGKAMFGLEVVRLDGSSGGTGTALLRLIGEALSVFTAGIGLLPALFGARGLHDLLAGTVVVRRGSGPGTEAPRERSRRLLYLTERILSLRGDGWCLALRHRPSGREVEVRREGGYLVRAPGVAEVAPPRPPHPLGRSGAGRAAEEVDRLFRRTFGLPEGHHLTARIHDAPRGGRLRG